MLRVLTKGSTRRREDRCAHGSVSKSSSPPSMSGRTLFRGRSFPEHNRDCFGIGAAVESQHTPGASCSRIQGMAKTEATVFSVDQSLDLQSRARKY